MAALSGTFTDSQGNYFLKMQCVRSVLSRELNNPSLQVNFRAKGSATEEEKNR